MKIQLYRQLYASFTSELFVCILIFSLISTQNLIHLSTFGAFFGIIISVCLPILFFAWDCEWVDANFNGSKSPNSTHPNDGSSNTEASTTNQSILMTGGLVGSLFHLFAVENLGRKKSTLILAIPLILASWLTVLAQNRYWFYVARLLIGLAAGGASISAPIFIAEISSDCIRGILNLIFILLILAGKAAGLHIAKLVTDYRQQAIYTFVVPAVFALGLCFLPESPIYLTKRKQFKAAKHSTKFYLGCETSRENEILPETEKLFTHQVPIELNSTLDRQDSTEKSATRKALIIATVMTTMSSFSGVILVLCHKAEFFTKLGSTLPPLDASVWVAVIALGATTFAICLIDWIGRKFLLTASLIGTATGFFIISISHWCKDQFKTTDSFPFTAFLFTIFIACTGILPISHVYKMDVLPPKIRNATIAILHVLFWALSVGAIIAYPFQYLITELYGCFVIFGGFCLVYALFVFIYVPETNGKSYREIAAILEK